MFDIWNGGFKEVINKKLYKFVENHTIRPFSTLNYTSKMKQLCPNLSYATSNSHDKVLKEFYLKGWLMPSHLFEIQFFCGNDQNFTQYHNFSPHQVGYGHLQSYILICNKFFVT